MLVILFGNSGDCIRMLSHILLTLSDFFGFCEFEGYLQGFGVGQGLAGGV